MPLMHSEDIAVQEAALPLFERFSDPRTADFARRHRDVIARFGRFPHRNTLPGPEPDRLLAGERGCCRWRSTPRPCPP
jgi:uncharacterized protein (DUF924 family)